MKLKSALAALKRAGLKPVELRRNGTPGSDVTYIVVRAYRCLVFEAADCTFAANGDVEAGFVGGARVHALMLGSDPVKPGVSSLYGHPFNDHNGVPLKVGRHLCSQSFTACLRTLFRDECYRWFGAGHTLYVSVYQEEAGKRRRVCTLTLNRSLLGGSTALQVILSERHEPELVAIGEMICQDAGAGPAFLDFLSCELCDLPGVTICDQMGKIQEWVEGARAGLMGEEATHVS